MNEPDIQTLRTMWRYHLGQAYWNTHQMMTIGLYDAPHDRIVQYTAFGATNVLLSALALWLGAMLFPTPHFQELAAAGWIELAVNATFGLIALFGLWLIALAWRVARTQRAGGDTDACDPLRRAAMRRAYRWAVEQGWIHQVEGRLIFDRRAHNLPATPPDTERRHGQEQVDAADYPADRHTAPPIRIEDVGKNKSGRD